MSKTTGPCVGIVSGLPRSGTSLMMRMLEAGGMPVLTDGLRAADQENPGGYYEFERVKQIERDSSWVKLAQGGVVKMVYRLLYHLPSPYDYRILFMRRNLAEVVQSQNEMLARSCQQDTRRITDQRMVELFTIELQRVLDWLQGQPHMSVLEVSFNDLLQDAEPVVHTIAEFLDWEPDVKSMLGIIDPALYRNRGEL